MKRYTSTTGLNTLTVTGISGGVSYAAQAAQYAAPYYCDGSQYLLNPTHYITRKNGNQSYAYASTGPTGPSPNYWAPMLDTVYKINGQLSV